MLVKRTYTQEELTALLQRHGINPTAQRLEIARLLFARAEHVSAEDVFMLVNTAATPVSKATVYNTLGLFAERGLIREVIADPNKVFYDPNTAPHYHFYDVATGQLTDIDAEGVQITGLPSLPEGARMEGVDVIVRLRQSDRPTH
ncbi:MAG: transcriptional repressor [Gammaproteobacteria bacterium]|nr:transcriptional repressor [Gammaproteobacteria bacterium]